MELGLDEVVGYHGVEHRPGEPHTIACQNLEVVLKVLSYLLYFWVFVQRFEYVYNLLGFFTIGRHRHVECLAFLDREAQSYEFCPDGLR